VGVLSFLANCWEVGVRVAIISHKTRHPYRGPRHDLHAAAHQFLEARGFYSTHNTGLSPDSVFLEPTLADKLRRIDSLGCTVFVDDLPELLAESGFPRGVRKVLFDPDGAHPDGVADIRVTSWAECGRSLLAQREVVV